MEVNTVPKLVKFSKQSGKFVTDRTKYMERSPTLRELISKNQVPEFISIQRYNECVFVSPAFEVPALRMNTMLAVVIDFNLEEYNYFPGDLIEVHLDESNQEMKGDIFDSVSDHNNICIRGEKRECQTFRDNYKGVAAASDPIALDLVEKRYCKIVKQTEAKLGRKTT